MQLHYLLIIIVVSDVSHSVTSKSCHPVSL